MKRVLVLCFGLLAAALCIAGPVGAQVLDWVQVGPDIDGEAAGDLSGSAVSLSADGMRLAVGAVDNDGFTNGAGHVRVFDLSSGSPVQLGADLDGQGSTDTFGEAVSLSDDGSRLAVGASRATNTVGVAEGIAYVFDWDGVNWVQVGSDVEGEDGQDDFGSTVSLSEKGDFLAVGAPRNQANGLNSGHVRVFELDAGDWVQLGVDIDGALGDRMGTSVSLSDDGSRVAVGAVLGTGIVGPGFVRVLEWDGAVWAQLGADVVGEANYDDFGFSVSLAGDGSGFAAGAPGNNDSGNSSGHVQVHRLLGGVWVQVGSDIDGGAASDKLGSSVSLVRSPGNSRVVVGAVQDSNIAEPGYARVLDFDGTDWVQVGSDIVGEGGDDESGFAVALSDDRNFVAVGAPDNDGNGADSGHVRVFELGVPVLLCDGLVVTVDIGAGDVPTVGDDVILGTDLDDTISALAGDDTICGEGGDDLIIAGGGVDIVFGGDGDDRLLGQSGDDVLYGEGDNDELLGGVGDDIAWGGDGDDDLRGQGGVDTLNGEAGVDQFFGGSDDDVINTGDGGNVGSVFVVRGQGGDDTITGSDEDDVLEGGAGRDTIYGGEGDDELLGGRGRDTIYGEGGNDVIEGADTKDFLYGGSGNDVISGGLGDDELFGEAGNDDLHGQGDADLCDGGAGVDTATPQCETVVDVP